MSRITDTVRRLAAPIAERHGCEIWDVEFVKEAGQHYLRVFIDREGSVSIEDCEKVSRELGDILDEEDPIPDSYIFEVGSAGAERVLKRPSDFARFMGSRAEVKLYKGIDGVKSFSGTLCGYEDGAVEINTGTETLRFEKLQIAQVRLRIN